MAGAPGIEGALSVRLQVGGGRVTAARVRVQRPLAAARALGGRTVADALKLVPLLFSVCSTAQGMAALTACEQALGIDAPPDQRIARDLLVMGETATSHGWHVLMDWPRLLEETPSTEQLAALRTATGSLMSGLYPERDSLAPGGGALHPKEAVLRLVAARLDAHITQSVFGGAPCPTTVDELEAWAGTGDTAAARLMAETLDEPNPGYGSTGVPLLTGKTAAWFAARLAADPAFSLAPLTEDGPAVTGPAAAAADSPLVRAVTARFGANGLVTLLAARLAALAALPGRMDAAIDALLACPGSPAPTAAPGTGGTGTAVVDTARGTLVHWAQMQGGIITDYRIAAPTEWNFHPDGTLARGLTGVEAGPGLHGLAARLITALDPCVGWALDIDRNG